MNAASTGRPSSGGLSRQTLDLIKDRIDIVDFISRFVKLDRRGTSITGLCPFHSEKTASFHVRQDEGRYYCFGCGAKGDVFDFLVHNRGISFIEAVSELADIAGVQIVGDDKAKRQKSFRRELLEVNALAHQFYQEALHQAPEVVRVYLEQRGLSKELQQAYGIGFAPNEWRGFYSKISGDRMLEQAAEKAGLIRRGEKGEYYDLFRGRLIFPIFLDRKSVVGFGGRLIPGLESQDRAAKLPKYINSPESELYKKSRTLYGLPQARNAIRESGEVYVVEGYMDVISLWGKGVKNVVATCGTALTRGHVEVLGNLSKKVKLLFDGDIAGQSAAAKSFPTFMNAGIQSVAVFLPEGEDPDSLARRSGENFAKELKGLEQAALFECFLREAIRSYGEQSVGALGPELKGRLAKDIGNVLTLVENSIEKLELARYAEERLALPREGLLAFLDNTGASSEEKTELPAPEGREIREEIAAFSDLPKVDRALLHAVMARKESFPELILKDVELRDRLVDSSFRFILELNSVMCSGQSRDSKKEDIRELLSSFGPSWVEAWREAHRMSADKDVSIEQIFQDSRAAVLVDGVRDEIRQLNQQIDSAREEAQRLSLVQRKIGLERKLRGMQSR